MTNQTTDHRYFTHDLGLAAALISCGHQLDGLDRSDQRKAQFIFCSTSELINHANDYWADGLTVAARAFFNNVKMLKNRIYSEWGDVDR